MRAITIMYDSLNRKYLPCYGDVKTIAPNFKRLEEYTVIFDSFYVGSLPCMPARRELHTGRYNFMHRCWGPLEPFDDSMPAILGKHGIYSHCVTDHAHYWQEGGSTYLTKFSSCEMIRGQEGDFWIGKTKGFTHNIDLHRQDMVNRTEMIPEENHPHYKTFRAGMKFLEDNVDNDNWYLHIEYFDPHEPYFVPDKYKKLYSEEEIEYDWPLYGEVEQNAKEVNEAGMNYRAVLSMCDNYLGKILDFMDEHDMWKDTMLIVNTDHGYMLGEHGFFGKNYQPNYEEIVHTPFFLWNPEIGLAGERRKELAQTIDIAPTILDYFHIDKPKDMLGNSLLPIIKNHQRIHNYILFGYFGKHVNITDGHYVYMRAGRSANEGLLNNYTLLPLHMFEPFSIEELEGTEKVLVEKFGFTKGAPVMKIPASGRTSPKNTCYMFEEHMKYGDILFDLDKDPEQIHPLKDNEVERKMTEAMKKLMDENEAPIELYKRLGLY